jgi:cytochrome b subunit of formate dehydrogenase
LAVAAIALFLGHLAHVFITKHGRTYLSGMIRGWIPEELARERHVRWWREEKGSVTAAGRTDGPAPGGSDGAPSGAPPAQTRPESGV